MFIKPVYAQIINPALPSNLQADPGGTGLAFYISQIWKTVIVVGGLAFLMYLVTGGLEWLTAGGDKSKVEGAQKKISNALVGLTLLVSSYAIVAFLSEVLQIDILNIDWTFGGS